MGVPKADLNYLLNQARVKLPGSSDAGIKHELYEVLHEFFDTTNAWKQDVQINVQPYVQAYIVSASEGQIIRLFTVLDSNLFQQPAVLLAPSQPGPPGGSTLNPANSGTPPNPSSEADFMTVMLQLQYSQAQIFTVSLILNVMQPHGRDGIPDMPSWTLSKFGRVVLDGLLGKMMGQPSKSYTQDSLSVYHLKRFRDGMAMVRASITRSNSVGSQNWVFPQNYRTRNQRGGVSVGSQTGFGF
jgi:hypothetical protein